MGITIEANELSPVLEVLDRLWQTKIEGVTFLDQWREDSSDADLKVGLKSHLEDERRHLRLIGEEIIRLGGRVSSDRRESLVSRAYELARAQEGDLYKLIACYGGIKLFTMRRIGQLVPFVERGAGELLDRIACDEERHVRWADIRIERLMTPQDTRKRSLLTDRMEQMLEAVWQKSRKDIIQSGQWQTS